MTKERTATLTASIGAGLLFLTAWVHLSAYSSVVARAAYTGVMRPGSDLRPLIAAAWIAGGASLIIAALLAIAATPLFIVRRRALLGIAALTPVSIAILQIVYLGFLPPTALLLLDAGVLVLAGELGRAHQPRPVNPA